MITKKGKSIDLAALVAGILSGIFQILGFFRWLILIPMLSRLALTIQSFELVTVNLIYKER